MSTEQDSLKIWGGYPELLGSFFYPTFLLSSLLRTIYALYNSELLPTAVEPTDNYSLVFYALFVQYRKMQFTGIEVYHEPESCALPLIFMAQDPCCNRTS